MTGRQGVSHLARATCAKIGERLLGKAIEPSRFGVALDPLVEPRSLQFLKPSAKFRELIGRQCDHGFFDVFES